MPANSVYVGRPTKWGNPFAVKECGTAAVAMACYRSLHQEDDAWRETVRRELRGKNLACWCPLGEPCHADVLLKIANPGCGRASVAAHKMIRAGGGK